VLTGLRQPALGLPCSLFSHQPPSRACGDTENNEATENMAASLERAGRKATFIQKDMLMVVF
jgi:hypothetical protein